MTAKIGRSIKRQEKRKRWMDLGLCPNCGRERIDKDLKWCVACTQSTRKHYLKKKNIKLKQGEEK